MPLKLLKELGIEKEINEKNDDSSSRSAVSELEELGINLSNPNFLEIITPRLLSVEALGKLLYLIYNKLNYLFDYLDYRIVVQGSSSTTNKSNVQAYFSLIFSTS